MNLADLDGKWFTQFYQVNPNILKAEPPFTNNAARNREGTCPQTYWQRLPVKKEDQDAKLYLKGLNLGETFAIHHYSKALVNGITRDWIAKGSFIPEYHNTMTTWPGFTLLPSSAASPNMKVLALNDEYMILYRCAEQYTYDLQGGE